MSLPRRKVLGTLAALAGCASAPKETPKAQVVVVGAGFGGATAARYLRLFSAGRIGVTLIDPQARLASTALSNLVLEGSKELADLSLASAPLEALGVQRRVARVSALDLERRQVRFGEGEILAYERLVLAPGIDFMSERIEGLKAAAASLPQAWKGGAELGQLRAQLEAMPNGGVFVLSIPEAPYRAPLAPYERASLVAAYFQRVKPRSKVVVLDANPEPPLAALWRRSWAEHLPGLIEYLPRQRVVAVDAARRALRVSGRAELRGDVLNLLPPMRAADLMLQAGLATVEGRWCAVHAQDLASPQAPGVHVIGDAAHLDLPKTAHLANSQAKLVAARISAELLGLAPEPQPLLGDAEYAFVTRELALQRSALHGLEGKGFRALPGSAGQSTHANELEAAYAQGWVRNLWADAGLS